MLEDRIQYHRSNRHKMYFILICIAAVVAGFFLSISVGFYNLSFADCYRVFIDHLTGNVTDPRSDNIIFNIRIPIAVFAVIAGAALAVGGAVMQSILHNPLADPYTMGISSGASLGASLAIIAGITVGTGLSHNTTIVVMAFMFSLIPMAVILVFSVRRKTTPTMIILIGIAVMYMFSAVTSLLMVTASEESLAEIYQWRVGSLATIEWDSIPIPLAVTAVSIVILMSQYRKINVLMTGPTIAHTLGVAPKRTILFLMLVVSLMTSAVVCFCGTIGFIGLVGPHIARKFVGSDSKFLLPASAVFGAMFLLIANTIASRVGTYGLPVGVVSAIIGCPLFIFILINMRKNSWR